MRHNGDVKVIAGLGHQTSWPCRVEEGRRVEDLDAGVGSQVGLELRVGFSCKGQEDGRHGWQGSIAGYIFCFQFEASRM